MASEAYHLIVKDGTKLTPFLLTLLLYFGIVRQDSQNVLATTLLKCAPIVALIFYVQIKGLTLNESSYRSSRYILCGLIFSGIGDALLNVNLFPLGMVSFAVTHIFYIKAFNWQPLKLGLGKALYIIVIIFCCYIYKHLDPLLSVGVPIYSVLITTMLWRALARAYALNDFLSKICAFGAALFVISDGLISVTMFVGMSIPYARLCIMGTYYASQFAIALSTINGIQGINQKH